MYEAIGKDGAVQESAEEAAHRSVNVGRKRVVSTTN